MNKNIIAIILIIAGAGIYFTLTRPIMAETKDIKATKDQLSTALANVDEIVRVREDIVRKFNAIPESDRTRLDRIIPSAVDNIRLVIDLNNLALQHHFALSNVRATTPGTAASAGAGRAPTAMTPQAGAVSTGVSLTEPTLDKVTVSFNVTATYDAFIQFIQALEADLRISDITHLAVTANDDGDYDFDVSYQTYWLRQ